MNVFDFDKTIYLGDSTVDFYLYCIGKNKRCLQVAPRFFLDAVFHALHRIDTDIVKSHFYQFLGIIKVTDKFIEEFWEMRKGKFNDTIVSLVKTDDVVVSASPRFLLHPVCNKLGVVLIASEVNPDNGRCISPNCKGTEKVRRFRELYPNAVIDSFYSDSKSDAPLANQAKQSFLVKGNRIQPFPL